MVQVRGALLVVGLDTDGKTCWLRPGKSGSAEKEENCAG